MICVAQEGTGRTPPSPLYLSLPLALRVLTVRVCCQTIDGVLLQFRVLLAHCAAVEDTPDTTVSVSAAAVSLSLTLCGVRRGLLTTGNWRRVSYPDLAMVRSERDKRD